MAKSKIDPHPMPAGPTPPSGTSPGSRRPRLTLINGWAHSGADLIDLSRVLDTVFNVHVVSAAAVLADRAASVSGLDDAPDVIAGWSLGGMVAIETVLARDLAVPLVLISTTAKFCSGADWDHGLNRSAVRSLKLGLRRDRSATLESFYRDCRSPATDPADQSTPELEAGLDYLLETDLRARVSNLSSPTLVLHGGLDPVIPPAASAFLARQIGGSVRHIDPIIGHALPIARADWVAERIIEFWHGPTGSGA